MSSARATNPWADLVIAILSINSYPLDRTFALFAQLEPQGLFDRSQLASATASEVARRSGEAEYDRGHTMTAIFPERLMPLGALAKRKSVADSQRVLETGARAYVERLLANVKGVGPKVLENYFLLRGAV